MAIVNNARKDYVQRLIIVSKKNAAIRNKKITTVDNILKVAKKLYPTLTDSEQMELSQIALKIILNETSTPAYQTTLLAHM